MKMAVYIRQPHGPNFLFPFYSGIYMIYTCVWFDFSATHGKSKLQTPVLLVLQVGAYYRDHPGF